ncbi:SGNH/GDSL hydrolase family protein [Streptomyces sp. NPDC002088]|uniref:SGNH/GDSL hydrolase family protein n=1 Tax=Streptomyces sp. NPDC002088 TaxID=3154665 RepID=UPI00331B2F01
MTRRHGCALLSAITALIVVLSAAIYVGVAADDGDADAKNGLASVRAGAPHHSAAPASTGVWVGAWSTSPSGAEPDTETNGMAGRSVRNVVHTAVGGTSARITLSNLYGTQPLTVTHASIAVAATADTATGADAATGTMRRLTFAGATSVVIPAGEQAVSDAVPLLVPHDSDILVTTYSPTASGPVTYHRDARQISYVADGDRTEDVTGTAYDEQSDHWRYLTALDVLSNESDGTVVALGDSLTDGVTSTKDANHRWTDVLSDRLRTAVESGADVPRYSVVNQGISGNRVLTGGPGRPADNASGLNRFGRDVLDRTNVKVVVIDLGVNDILRSERPADPEKILDGLRTLVRQAHARGIKVVGATLMPFQGHRRYTDAREEVRQEINAEIRAGKVYDAVVDFDKALRDPYNPRRLRSYYDSGDHLHPSDKGYRTMADAFDLDDLTGAAPAQL